MEKILSLENSKIKLLKKLAMKKYREQYGLFVVENLAIISDALESGYAFESLFVTEEFISKHDDFVRKVTELGFEYTVIDERVNKYFSNLDTPSGIAATYKMRKSVLSQRESVIYLNGISDPGNLGTILRSALAFGFVNVVVDEACADIYNAKTVGAAKDAIFKLNIMMDIDAGWLRSAKGSLPIYATSSHGGEKLADSEPDKSFCLVLGSESHGVSAEILSLADRRVMIPISAAAESLNVGVAAGIIMYKLRAI